MHVSHLDQAESFVTLDGSTIRELVGAVSLPAANQSLAEATTQAGERTAGDPRRLLCCCAPATATTTRS